MGGLNRAVVGVRAAKRLRLQRLLADQEDLLMFQRPWLLAARVVHGLQLGKKLQVSLRAGPLAVLAIRLRVEEQAVFLRLGRRAGEVVDVAGGVHEGVRLRLLGELVVRVGELREGVIRHALLRGLPRVQVVRGRGRQDPAIFMALLLALLLGAVGRTVVAGLGAEDGEAACSRLACRNGTGPAGMAVGGDDARVGLCALAEAVALGHTVLARIRGGGYWAAARKGMVQILLAHGVRESFWSLEERCAARRCTDRCLSY